MCRDTAASDVESPGDIVLWTSEPHSVSAVSSPALIRGSSLTKAAVVHTIRTLVLAFLMLSRAVSGRPPISLSLTGSYLPWYNPMDQLEERRESLRLGNFIRQVPTAKKNGGGCLILARALER